MTIETGELISQIRNLTKSVNQDNLYLSDRLIFSLIKKHLPLLLSREDSKMKISGMDFLYSTLPFVELVEVDKIEAGCSSLVSECTIKRTESKLPFIYKGYSTFLIREVSSIDGQIMLQATTEIQYLRKQNLTDAKYNKTLYYWPRNGHLYFPNIEWDAVRIVAMLADEVDNCGNVDPCKTAQESQAFIPEHLLSIVQAEVMKDILIMFQIPSDPEQDKKSPLR